MTSALLQAFAHLGWGVGWGDRRAGADFDVTQIPDRTTLQRWLDAATSPALQVVGPVEHYEAAIVRGEVPVREGSWHDVFNVLAFARFPAAKLALHHRVHELASRRTARARSREEDALTLIDECALVIAGPSAALARLAAARQRGALADIDEVVRGEGLRVECFGHALLEHLVLRRPPIGAGVVPLATTEPTIDGALAEAIARGTFAAPRLAPTLPWPDPVVDAWFQAGGASPRTSSTGSTGSSR